MTAVDGQIEYAYWLEPEGKRRVQYALPAFHELDFQVNEGYRRIPHGGIEIGGVLWGRRESESIIIEAFRQIPCEHASGPSFNLSPADLAALPTQLTPVSGDEELQALQPIGWFIAHTRGPLTVTDREREIFDQFFPATGDIMLLVKPERFQPTRFAFGLRDLNGTLHQDLSADAIILPLPGRGGKTTAGGPVPSIAAPSVAAPPKTGGQSEGVPREPAQEPVQQLARERVQQQTDDTSPRPTFSQDREIAAANHQEKLPPAVPEPRLRLANILNRAEALAPEPAEIAPAVAPKAGAPKAIVPESTIVPAPQVAAPEPQEAAAPRYLPIPAQHSRPLWRLVALFLLAAFAGSAAGYFAYLQLPPAYIPVEVHRQDNNIRVQWPAEQTKGVEYAAIRVNDGPPQVLSEQERQTGTFDLADSGQNFKIEIIAQHWFRDSRGILRYLTLERPAAPHASTTGADPTISDKKESLVSEADGIKQQP